MYQPQHVGITSIYSYVNTSALGLNKFFWTMTLSAGSKTIMSAFQLQYRGFESSYLIVLIVTHSMKEVTELKITIASMK